MIIVCGLVVFVSGLIGYHFSKKLAKKVIFYKNLVDFCGKLEVGVSFLQTTMPQIVKEEVALTDSEISPFLASLNNYYANKNEQINLPYYLKENEKNEIIKFFTSFGNKDQISEQKQLMAFKQSIIKKQQAAEENKNKNGTLVFKLATFIGLGLAIIIY